MIDFVFGFIQAYMRKFGYLPPQSESFASLLSADELRLGIENFQRFAGIAVTGEMNNETREWMNKPRCGNPDMHGEEDRFKTEVSYYTSLRRTSSKNLGEAMKFCSNLVTFAQIMIF